MPVIKSMDAMLGVHATGRKREGSCYGRKSKCTHDGQTAENCVPRLQPAAGACTAGLACQREGFDALLIEREADYVADFKHRQEHPAGGGTRLFGEG